MVQQNGTKLAAIATPSITVQKEDPARGTLSLWDWLTPTAVTSTATQTTADGRSLIATPMALNPGRACSPRAMLEQMKEHIPNISQDMHILKLELRTGVGAILPDAGAEVRDQKGQTGLQRHYRRAPFYKESSPSPIMHTRTDTSLHLHITTFQIPRQPLS